MRKLSIIVSIFFLSINSYGQPTRAATPGFSPRANQFFVVEDGNVSARNSLFVPRYDDTTQANTFILKDTLGAVIFTYDVMNLWVRTGSPKVWEKFGSGGGSGTVTNVATGYGLTGGPITTTGTIVFDSTTVFPQLRSTITASQGITKTGNDFQLGGPIGSEGIITTDRVINLNNKSISFQNNSPVTAPNSYFGIGAIDSINSLNPTQEELPTVAFGAGRTFRVPNYYSNQVIYKVGHALTTSYQAGDSARIYTVGGDFNGNFRSGLHPTFLPSKTTGRTIWQGGTVDFDAPFATLSIFEPFGSNASRHMLLRGWWAAHTAYLRMYNFPDTVENFAFNITTSFKEAASKVLKAYNYYANATPGDSNWSFISPYAANRFYNEGSVTIGGGYTSSAHKLRVHGDSYFTSDVGIGDNAAVASSMLSVSSTTKGVIWPRMTTVQKDAIASPATGLIVFDTDLVQYNFWDGDSWEAMGGGSSGITIGSTTITSGTNTRVLFNNSGVVGEYAISGTGNVAMTASPTFTGTVTMPTPFTLGATSVTSTGTQLNYLNAATGTTGTTSTNLVFSGAPTFTTSITAPTVYGSSAASGALSLSSTSNATKGGIFFRSQATGISLSMVDLTAGEMAFGNVASSLSAPSIIAKSNGGFRFTSGTTDGNTSGDLIFNVREDDNSDYTTLSNDAVTFVRFATTLMTIKRNGRVGIGTTPTAMLHLPAGTATANTAPQKFTAGVLLTTPESGVLETNAANELLYSSSTSAASRGFVSLDRYTATATSGTAGATNNVIDVTATGQTITLPTAVGIRGRTYTIKLTASGTGTVETTSSQTIDGSTTYSLSAQYKYVTVMSTDANWIIIGNN